MSIKLVIMIMFLLSIVYSCSEKKDHINVFNNLSTKEKDSVTQRYHNISNYFLQPSNLYRKYKDSALVITPENVEVRQKLSYSYKKKGEHIKAMQILNKAVAYSIEQNTTDALGYRAWSLLYYYRDYKGAIKDIEKIEEMTGMVYNICWGEPCGFQKGQALYKLKEFDQAIIALHQVNLEEEKKGFSVEDNIYINFYLGRCYEEILQYDKAILHYNKVLKSHDKFPEALYRLGKIEIKLSHFRKAKEYFILAKKYLKYKMQEPYIERFDELFPYMVDRELEELEHL